MDLLIFLIIFRLFTFDKKSSIFNLKDKSQIYLQHFTFENNRLYVNEANMKLNIKKSTDDLSVRADLPSLEHECPVFYKIITFLK